MSETSALGAAMAAGAAEGVDVWDLSPNHLPHVSSEQYEPQINCEGETATQKYLNPSDLILSMFSCSEQR